VIQSGGQGILRRTAHVQAGDDVYDFEIFMQSYNLRKARDSLHAICKV
jgi:hypothetical protein